MQSRDLFELLAREHAGMLSVYVATLTADAQLGEDLFQETLFVAWKTLDRYDRDRPFGQWLRGIARRLALQHRTRSRQHDLLCDSDALELLDARCAAIQRRPGDTLAEKLAFLRSCVSALPDRYQRAIVQRYSEGVKGSMLAARLDTSIENVKKLLQRGRELVSRCMTERLALEEESLRDHSV